MCMCVVSLTVAGWLANRQLLSAEKQVHNVNPLVSESALSNVRVCVCVRVTALVFKQKAVTYIDYR